MPEPLPPEDDVVLAGELALGLLEGEERAQALRRTLGEPAFRELVERWTHDLAPMLHGIEPVEPPAGVWQRIEADMAGSPATLALPVWRAVALAAALAAACLAFMLLTRPAPRLVAPLAREVYVAQLVGSGAEPVLVARFDPNVRRLRVRTVGLPDDGRRPELWVIAGKAPPASLGQVALNGSSEARLSAALSRTLVPGVTLAVTLEPAAEVPHAAPTGKILGTATLTAI